MIKLKELYLLPSTPVALTDYVLTEKWIPEVHDLTYSIEYGVLQELETEGLIQVKQLVYRDCDGERTAGMYTLWFRQAPVAIVHTSGRGGDENFRRWVTDAVRLFELCQYLRTKLSSEVNANDIYDPEHEVFPEEVFYLYGTYEGDKFGVPQEPAAKGFTLLHEGLIPDVDPTFCLVTATAAHDPMPEYVRRHECVLQRVAPVSDNELSRNPRVKFFAEEDGMPQIYWYRPVERPKGCTILAV